MVNGDRCMLVLVSVYSDDNMHSTTAFVTYDSYNLYLLEYGTWA